LANKDDTADIISAMVPMLTTALSLPISQYHCVTKADISEIYSKRAYSSKLLHRSLVMLQPLQLQLGFWSSKATSRRSYL